jgi:hypothetical protein
MNANTVPREFVGKARDLRRALEADDAVAYRVVGALTVPFTAIGRGTIPRPQLLARTANAWRDKIPTTGRLALEVELKKTSLLIRELRLLAADGRFDDWVEGKTEPGFSLAAYSLEVAPPRFRFDPVVLAGISLHAMARWFQRSFSCTRESLLADMLPLAVVANDERLANPGEFQVPAGDGRWAGVVMELNDRQPPERILAVRSFLTH